jgi:hypothetical protein
MNRERLATLRLRCRSLVQRRQLHRDLDDELSRACCVLSLLLAGLDLAIGQPPPPPPPPQFMTMKGFPLSCFEKPTFVEDGLEFFVCNGGGGLAGVRKMSDPAHTVFVQNPDIAVNLNMQTAKRACGNKRFAVASDANGTISFLCQGEETERNNRFKAASKADWKKYGAYLTK